MFFLRRTSAWGGRPGVTIRCIGADGMGSRMLCPQGSESRKTLEGVNLPLEPAQSRLRSQMSCYAAHTLSGGQNRQQEEGHAANNGGFVDAKCRRTISVQLDTMPVTNYA